MLVLLVRDIVYIGLEQSTGRALWICKCLARGGWMTIINWHLVCVPMRAKEKNRAVAVEKRTNHYMKLYSFCCILCVTLNRCCVFLTAHL